MPWAGADGQPLAPESEAQLAEMIRAANGPLRIAGGGTKAGWGAPVTGRPLSTAGLSGITLYEPGALTLVARAGTPLAEIEAALAAEGQILPFESPDHAAVMGREGTPTIGGAVAVNAAGPRRVRAGACRDALIGVRLVTGAGEIVKNGGRVMKNVTGYDLVKLLAGSFGTLGVLTEVSFKLLPAPQSVATLTLQGLEDRDAVALMAEALGTSYEVSGAAHLVMGQSRETHLRLEGLEASVAYRAEALQTALHGAGIAGAADLTITLDRGAGPWAALRDLSAFADAPGDLWRIAQRPSQAAQIVAALRPSGHLLDHGGATLWALMPEGTDARALLPATGVHASLVRASDATRARLGAFPREPDAVAALSRGLRARFDPRGILNPGLMG
ncbi:MAG: FAD-binding protein [Pseudomonadota bacterium]